MSNTKENNEYYPCFKCQKEKRHKGQSYCYSCHYENYRKYKIKKDDKARRLKSKIKIKSLGGEIWKPVEKWDNYEVSNLGRVKSLRRADNFGHIHENEVLLNPQPNTKGYLVVKLFSSNGNRISGIHRLVALHFNIRGIGHIDVHHKDGDKLNNKTDNLQWLSKRQHALVTMKETNFGKPKRGEEHGTSKLKNADVISIRDKYAKGCITQVELANIYSVNKHTIGKIINYHNWKHI